MKNPILFDEQSRQLRQKLMIVNEIIYPVYAFYCIIAGIGAGTPQQAKSFAFGYIFLKKSEYKSETCFNDMLNIFR